jgi:mRNA interferase MazF
VSLVSRGDIFDADLPGLRLRPVLVVTRQAAIPVLSSLTVALITSTVRGIRSEVPLNSEHGLRHACVASCDNLLNVKKDRLRERRGALSFEDVARLDDALRFALQLD